MARKAAKQTSLVFILLQICLLSTSYASLPIRTNESATTTDNHRGTAKAQLEETTLPLPNSEPQEISLQVTLTARDCVNAFPESCGRCSTGAQCDDGDDCTADSCDTECVGGECRFTPIPGCARCAESSDCDDGNVCTKDICMRLKCVHQEIEDCGSIKFRKVASVSPGFGRYGSVRYSSELKSLFAVSTGLPSLPDVQEIETMCQHAELGEVMCNNLLEEAVRITHTNGVRVGGGNVPNFSDQDWDIFKSSTSFFGGEFPIAGFDMKTTADFFSFIDQMSGDYVDIFDLSSWDGKSAPTVSNRIEPEYGWKFVDVAVNGKSLAILARPACVPRSVDDIVSQNVLMDDNKNQKANVQCLQCWEKKGRVYLYDCADLSQPVSVTDVGYWPNSIEWSKDGSKVVTASLGIGDRYAGCSSDAAVLDTRQSQVYYTITDVSSHEIIYAGYAGGVGPFGFSGFKFNPVVTNLQFALYFYIQIDVPGEYFFFPTWVRDVSDRPTARWENGQRFFLTRGLQFITLTHGTPYAQERPGSNFDWNAFRMSLTYVGPDTTHSEVNKPHWSEYAPDDDDQWPVIRDPPEELIMVDVPMQRVYAPRELYDVKPLRPAAVIRDVDYEGRAIFDIKEISNILDKPQSQWDNLPVYGTMYTTMGFYVWTGWMYITTKGADEGKAIVKWIREGDEDWDWGFLGRDWGPWYQNPNTYYTPPDVEYGDGWMIMGFNLQFMDRYYSAIPVLEKYGGITFPYPMERRFTEGRYGPPPNPGFVWTMDRELVNNALGDLEGWSPNMWAAPSWNKVYKVEIMVWSTTHLRWMGESAEYQPEAWFSDDTSILKGNRDGKPITGTAVGVSPFINGYVPRPGDVILIRNLPPQPEMSIESPGYFNWYVATGQGSAAQSTGLQGMLIEDESSDSWWQNNMRTFQQCQRVWNGVMDWSIIPNLYLCQPHDIGVRFSPQGKIPGHRCSELPEMFANTDYPDWMRPWENTYFCIAEESNYYLQLSPSGPLAADSCLHFNWGDRNGEGYLNYNQDWYKGHYDNYKATQFWLCVTELSGKPGTIHVLELDPRVPGAASHPKVTELDFGDFDADGPRAQETCLGGGASERISDKIYVRADPEAMIAEVGGVAMSPAASARKKTAVAYKKQKFGRQAAPSSSIWAYAAWAEDGIAYGPGADSRPYQRFKYHEVYRPREPEDKLDELFSALPGQFEDHVEPTKVAITPDSAYAFVTLSINNAIGVVNLQRKTPFDKLKISGIICPGTKNMMFPRNKMDASGSDNQVKLRNYPVLNMYQPNGIAMLESKSAEGSNSPMDYSFVTANLGKMNMASMQRVKNLELNMDRFNLKNYDLTPQQLKQPDHLGNLFVFGDMGQFEGKTEILYGSGGRSFSVWNLATSALSQQKPGATADPKSKKQFRQVFDSAYDLEKRVSEHQREVFNSGFNFDDTSSFNGPAPSDVVVGDVFGHLYGFVSLTAGHAVAVYDMSDPEEPEFVELLSSVGHSKDGKVLGGDIAPGHMDFVPADRSPTGCPLLFVGHQGTSWRPGSGTVAMYEMSMVGHPCKPQKKQ